MIDIHHPWNKSVKPVVTGFLSSILLTLAMFMLSKNHVFSPTTVLLTVLFLATLQALIQIIFFLHLGKEKKPHWSSISFIFTVIVLFIIVAGSLWIMYNLDYNMMPGGPLP